MTTPHRTTPHGSPFHALRLRLAKWLLPRNKGYHIGRMMRCDSECWQTGNCSGACER